MKAVIYHADAKFAWGDPVGDVYKNLFVTMVEQCHNFGMPVIHLTLDGFTGWGDENIFYAGLKAKDVVWNREVTFTKFLEQAPDDVYWFAEPDFVIYKMWPELTTDCAMLYREDDSVPMTPAWRMATPKALPFFRAGLEAFTSANKDWHGDSYAFIDLHQKMGSPKLGVTEYLDVSIEMRKYADYIKPGKYCKNIIGRKKVK